jgi:hypothetical protein
MDFFDAYQLSLGISIPDSLIYGFFFDRIQEMLFFFGWFTIKPTRFNRSNYSLITTRSNSLAYIYKKCYQLFLNIVLQIYSIILSKVQLQNQSLCASLL